MSKLFKQVYAILAILLVLSPASLLGTSAEAEVYKKREAATTAIRIKRDSSGNVVDATDADGKVVETEIVGPDGQTQKVKGVEVTLPDKVTDSKGNETTTTMDIITDGCTRTTETSKETKWQIPDTPVDLVVLTDASGSFGNDRNPYPEGYFGTTDNLTAVKSALTTLVDEIAQRNTDRKIREGAGWSLNDADRIQLGIYSGVDMVEYYNGTPTSDYGGSLAQSPSRLTGLGSYRFRTSELVIPDEDQTGRVVWQANGDASAPAGNQDGITSTTEMKLAADGIKDIQNLKDFITNYRVYGGTPTLPAIQDMEAAYNSEVADKGKPGNDRRTVYLVITDGVANGYRKAGSNTIYYEASTARRGLQAGRGYANGLEPTNNYEKRAQELINYGATLKQSLPKGDVIIGFFENYASFIAADQYYKSYDTGTINTGIPGTPEPYPDNNSETYNKDVLGYKVVGTTKADGTPLTDPGTGVRKTFGTALKEMASPDTVDQNGNPVSFYVQENDANAFAANVIKAAKAAIGKLPESTAELKISKAGYELKAFYVNGKQVVENVTDPATQVQGKVVQDRNDDTKVTVTVVGTAFNPGNEDDPKEGKNKFSYELKKKEGTGADAVDEGNEANPGEGYTPGTTAETPPFMTGSFKVGTYTSPDISGSPDADKNSYEYTVKLEDIEYCYPTVEKSIKDNSTANDSPVARDPFKLSPKTDMTSGVTLDEAEEHFTYTIDYNFNNGALIMDDHVRLFDNISSYFEVVNATATVDGQTTVDGQPVTAVIEPGVNDPNGPGNYTLVYAEIPTKNAGNLTTGEDGYVNETDANRVADYGGYSMLANGGQGKKAQLVIKAKIKDEYKDDKTILAKLAALNATDKYPNDGFKFKVINGVTSDIKELDQTKQNQAVPSFLGVYNQAFIGWGLENLKETDTSKFKKTETVNGKEVTTSTVRKSNAVYVKPPLSPYIKKQVEDDYQLTDMNDLTSYNGKPYILPTQTSEFTYTLRVPYLGATGPYSFTDVLEPELQILTAEGDVDYTINGIAKDDLVNEGIIDLPVIKIDGNKITVTLSDGDGPIDEGFAMDIITDTENPVTGYNGDGEVIIKFKARVRDKASLARFADPVTGKIEVPNKASLHLEDPSLTKPVDENSNTVYVTPPVPDKPEPIKTIEEAADKTNLATGSEIPYTYGISATLPKGWKEYKRFEFEDTLIDALSFVNPAPDITDLKMVIRSTADDGTVSDRDVSEFFTFTKDGKTVRAVAKETAFTGLGEGVTITFLVPAKVNKDAAVDTNHKNTAKVIYNDGKTDGEKETNDVFVKVPPITKKVGLLNPATENEQLLPDRTAPFYYTISTTVPENSTSFEVYDTIDKVLEFVSTNTTVEAKVGDTVIPADKITIDDQTLKVQLDEALVKANVGKAVTVTFQAKVRADANLNQPEYIQNGIPKVPNTANYRVNDNPDSKRDSNTVYVTPPSPEPPLEKKVSDNNEELKDAVELTAREEVFTYTLNTQIPYDSTIFEVTDQIEPVLQFAGEGNDGDVVVKVDGQEVNVTPTIADKLLTVNLTSQLSKAGAKVEITFKAQIMPGVSLKDYEAAPNNGTIPNKFKIKFNNLQGETKNPESNPVTVTPPNPEEPTIKKDVTDADEVEKEDVTLGKRDEEFTYTLETHVPYDATDFFITDEIKPELEFVSTKDNVEILMAPAGATRADATAIAADAGATTTIEDQLLTVKFTDKFTQENGGKLIIVKFKAKIRDGANLSVYDNDKVPNQAVLNFTDKKGEGKKPKSNEVFVTPPPKTDPPISKTVNNTTDITLGNRTDSFTYDIKSTIPFDAKSFVIKDTIEPVLAFVSGETDVIVTVDGNKYTDATVKISDRVLTVTFEEDDLKKNIGGKAVNVQFVAKIKEGANLSGYTDPVGKVPNKASYKINNNPDVESEPVYVTPPTPEKPGIEKEVTNAAGDTSVNGVDLAKRDETFTYTIKTKVPEDATAFVIKDTLVPQLQFGENNASVTGVIAATPAINLAADQFNFSDQTLTVTLTPDQVTQNGGKDITVTFTAKIREGANLSAYEVANVAKVPNTAAYLLNNDPKEYPSNEVTVTPPPPTDPDITKTVTDENETDSVDATLGARDEVFTYTIKTTMPMDATGFVITDPIEPVLAFEGEKGQVTIQVGTETLDAAIATVNGQTLTITFTEDQVKANGGKPITVTFKARIREGANLSKYVEEDSGKIPNRASYDIPDKPGSSKTSDPAKVTPPPPTPPVITKDVTDADQNNVADATLGARDEVFTYTINTTIPYDAKKFVISDTIKDVLAFNGTNGQAAGTIAADPAVQLTAEQFAVNGQTLTVTLTAEQLAQYGGKAISVNFKANLKPDVNLVAAGFVDSKVPNTASYEIDNNPAVNSEPVTVSPPPPPAPPLTKTVSDVDQPNVTDATLGKRDEVFTYTLKTTMPVDATAFTINDTIKPELEFVGTNGSVQVMLNGQNVTDQVTKAETADQTLTVEFTKEQIAANSEKEIVVTFQARIKEGANLTVYPDKKVPNTFTYTVNHDPNTTKESDPVTVTPPPRPNPPIEKDINGGDALTLDKRNDIFTYNIKTTMPLDATTFTITDELKEVLRLNGDVKVTIAGEEVAAEVTQTVNPDNPNDTKHKDTLTVKFTEAQVKENGGKAVVVSFTASIKEGANLTAYETNNVASVPNTASYIIDNDPKVDSNTVPVTPPTPEVPEIEKDVNGFKELELMARNEVFTYNIKTTMPLDANAFTITDELKEVLRLNGEVVVTIGGQEVAAEVTQTVNPDNPNDTKHKDTLIVNFTEDQVKENGGKAVVVSFKASIKEGANLTAYTDSKVPNTAKYTIDNDPKTSKDSNEVPVWPPNPENPPIRKDVNTLAEVTLKARDEVFTYNINTLMPTDAKAFTITDTLKDVLAFNGEKGQVTITIGDLPVDSSIATVDGQKLTVKFTEEQVKENGGKAILVSFKANIKPDANLSEFETNNIARVPNTADYTIDNNPDKYKETEPVHVTPPTPPTPPIVKDVTDADQNNVADASLGARNEVFTYNITTEIPHDAESFTVTDTLKSVLEFNGADAQATVTINGQAATVPTTIDGKTITFKFTDKQVKENGGHAVVISFKANIVEGANLADYIVDGRTSIPNIADYQIDNDPKMDSNPVHVTPPTPPTPPVVKDVNGDPSATLEARDEVFTYNITTAIPEDATAFEINDELEPVLEFNGAKGQATVTLDGKDVTADVTITTDGQALKVVFTEEQVKANGAKEVLVSFKANIKAGANLSSYIVKDDAGNNTVDDNGNNVIEVPNVANYVINNNPTTKKESNVVPVTPPNEEQPPITKTVNNKLSELLPTRDNSFTYTINTFVPLDATSFVITDELEPVLKFDGDVRVTIGGKEVETQVTKDVNFDNLNDTTRRDKLTVNLTEAQVKANGGKAVVVTFNAKIKDGANLSGYVKNEITSIPNTANYVIDNNPKTSKDSNTVPVTPPTPEEPEIKKDVNGEPSAELFERDEVFTYNITTAVPVDAIAFEINDELEPVLAFNGDVTVTLAGQPIEAQVTIDGQKLKVKLTEEQVKPNGGQEVVVTFNANIIPGANLSNYIEDGVTNVPNVANYVINNNPSTKKESNIVPVTPPDNENPPITKDVNGKDAADLTARDEVFTYNIKTTMPTDATAFEITDTLEPVLEFVGIPTVTIDGQAVDTNMPIVDQNLTVTFTPAQVAANGGKAVVVSFQARIKPGANLTAYEDADVANIPNTASYVINNDPDTKKDSNTVPVTPPNPENPPIVKDVNGAPSAELAAREEVFTYNIKTTIPGDSTAFAITDNLEPVLEFINGVDGVKVAIDGQAADTDITIDGQLLTVNLTEEQVTTLAGKDVVVSFQAKIREGANLADYIVDGAATVPNQAEYIIDNNPDTKRGSNVVPVIPPVPPVPEIEKDVNNQPGYTLNARDEVFTYHIKTTIPYDAVAFTITDELEPVLGFEGPVLVSIEGQDVQAQVSTNGQNLTVDLTEEQVKTKGGQEVVVTFNARIKAGANLSKYKVDDVITVPNIAEYVINNNPSTKKESNIVPVTPPTPEDPEISKTVDKELALELSTREQVFTYDITTTVPFDAKAFEVNDTLEPVLAFNGDVTVTLDGKAIEADVTVDGQDLNVKLTDAQVTANGGKSLVVSFKANIKEGANLSAYIVDGVTKVPNTANYVINNDPKTKKDSNTVPVTPPTPENPPISKDINGAEGAEIATRKDTFTYNIKTAMPVDATAFTITDEIEPVLQFASEDVEDVKVTLDGKEVKASVSMRGQLLTVDFSPAQVAANGGKAIVVTFDAKIREGANLSAYIVNGITSIPNVAEYVINDDPNTKKGSNEVPVTPPDPENPPISKDVNGAEAHELEKREEVFTYNIKTAIPTDATAFTITDDVEDVLEIQDGSVVVTIDGKAVEAKVNIDKDTQVLTVDLTPAQVAANGEKPVIVSFNAKIKAGANLASYMKDGVVSVPNTASYIINNDPKTKKDSNEVPVTPPPTPEPPITKDVKGKESLTLGERHEVFTYNIKSIVPEDATVFTITDTLEPVLEFNGPATVTIDGKKVTADVTTEGQTLTVNLTPAQVTANGGKAVVVSFDAKIRDNVNLSGYLKDDGISVPNTASYVINNDPKTKKDSNEVPVRPPSPDEPDIVKDVNNKNRADLVTRDEVFTYNITSTVPTDKTAFTISDTLVDVLEFNGKNGQAIVKIGEEVVKTAVSIDGQTISVRLTDAQIAQYAGKEIKVSFKANIKAGANLAAYVDNMVTSIPNTANYTFNDDPQTRVDSNEVPVVPPTPENPPIVKDVNGKEAETLDGRNDVFTYNITTAVPTDAEAFKITDTLENVLEFQSDATVIIGGKVVETNVSIDGQNLTVELTQEQVEQFGGREVVVTFDAKIKDGANLSGYADAKGNVKVPNTSAYVINNNPRTYKESNTVPVTPPNPGKPDIKKDVNGQGSASLTTRDEAFTYNITTAVPVDATAFTISDTLEDVLEFNGNVTVTLAGKAIEAEVVIDGQTLTVDLTEDQVKANGGQAVVVSFKANIKPGSNLTSYVKDGQISIPNTANYVINHDPNTRKDSNKVPVTPPDATNPGVSKAVNGQQAINLATLGEVFTYTIDTTMPEDASAFEISDTLEPVLEYNGDIAVQIGSEMVEPELKVSGQTMTVVFSAEQVAKYAGQHITVTFNANISGNALEEELAAYAGKKVPNTATIKIDNKATKKSNTVTVVPPTPDKPENGKPSKMIENVDGSNPTTYKNLPEDTTEFRYHISANLGTDLTQFAIADTLEPVLEITNGRIEVTATGAATSPAAKELEEAKKKLAKLQAAEAAKAAESTTRNASSSSSASTSATNSSANELQASTEATEEEKTAESAEIEALEDQVADVNSALTGLKDDLKALEAAKKEATSTYNAEKAAYDKEVKAAKAAANTTLKELTNQVKALKAVEAPSQDTEESSTSTTASSEEETVYAEKVVKAIETLTTQLNKLEAIENANTSLTAIQDELTALVNANNAVIDELNAKVELTEAEVEYNEALATLNADIEKVLTYINDNLAAKVDALYAIQAPAAVDNTTVDANIKAAQAEIKRTTNELNTLKADIEELTSTTISGTNSSSTAPRASSTAPSVSSASSSSVTPTISSTVAAQKAEITKQETVVAELEAAAKKEAELYAALKDGKDIVNYIVENGLGTLVVNGNSVRLEITDEDTLASLAGYKIHLYIYANIKDGADLTDYLVGSRYEVPNTATVEFNHNPVETNTVKVARPKKTVPPSTPRTPTPPSTSTTRTVTRTVTRNNTTSTPTTRTSTLPATGTENNFFLEVMAGLTMMVVALFTLVRGRRQDV